jgi:hypothetical protein
MAMVALPIGQNWHYVDVLAIQAIKFAASKKSVVFLVGGRELEVSEDSHVVHKRIDDFQKTLS